MLPHSNLVCNHRKLHRRLLAPKHVRPNPDLVGKIAFAYFSQAATIILSATTPLPGLPPHFPLLVPAVQDRSPYMDCVVQRRAQDSCRWWCGELQLTFGDGRGPSHLVLWMMEWPKELAQSALDPTVAKPALTWQDAMPNLVQQSMAQAEHSQPLQLSPPS
jgi:hypothetical protein